MNDDLILYKKSKLKLYMVLSFLFSVVFVHQIITDDAEPVAFFCFTGLIFTLILKELQNRLDYYVLTNHDLTYYLFGRVKIYQRRYDSVSTFEDQVSIKKGKRLVLCIEDRFFKDLDIIKHFLSKYY